MERDIASVIFCPFRIDINIVLVYNKRKDTSTILTNDKDSSFSISVLAIEY